MKNGRTTIGEVVKYLLELPQDLSVLTQLVEDNSFTVIVDSKGEARTMRNSDKDHRWMMIDLPARQ